MTRFLLILATVAALHAQSFPGSVYTPLIAKDNIQTTLSQAMAPGDTTAFVASTTNWAANMVAYICDTSSGTRCTGTFEVMLVTAVPGSNALTVTRGYGGTSAIAHASGKAVLNAPAAVYNTTLSNEVHAIETALGPNLTNVPVSPIVNAALYNYAAQTPNVPLTAGVGASITLTPCPLGVNGTDTRLRFYLSGGSGGSAESAASTGAGTCTSGAATGTVTFTPANNHSGAWTLRSSHAGLYEAIAANPGREVHVPGGSYTMRDCMSLNPAVPLTLTGDTSSGSGTLLLFTGVTSGCHAITITEPGIAGTEPITISNLMLQGTGTTTGGDGIYLHNVVRVTLQRVEIVNFALNGVEADNTLEVKITDGCVIGQNARWGVLATGTSNLLTIRDSYVTSNSRSNNYGNIAVVGTSSGSPTETIVIDNTDIESAGLIPFTTVTTAYGILAQNITSLAVTNNYIEGNVSNAILYNGAVTGLVETGNWFNTGTIAYTSTVTGVKSWANTFYGAAAYRQPPTDISTYDIGYDSCLNSSPECAARPRMLGNVTQISTTGAVTAAKVSNYIAAESGGSANNALVVALLDQSGTAVPLASGFCFTLKLSHSLQVGANTIVVNGSAAKSIKSHLNPANNIGVAYVSGGLFSGCYDGTVVQDGSQ